MNPERQRLFKEAIDHIVTLQERERHGIGMQKEKTLHAVVKHFEDADEDHQEIPIEGYIADIFTGERIIEIQNGNFNKLRGKLDAFLPFYPVTIVYPIPHRKWNIWIDPQTGELKKRNRCAREGSFYQAFRELYRIRPYLTHPNLQIELLLIDMEEYRLQDGWSRDGKRGSHRYDRLPLALFDERTLSCPQDYRMFLPYELPEPFTAAQLARAAGFRDSFSGVLQLLTGLGVTVRVGKKGRAYLYRAAEDWEMDEAHELKAGVSAPETAESAHCWKNGEMPASCEPDEAMLWRPEE